jgi:hypothetical protein
LAAHCGLQSRCVENVTLDDGDPLWIGVGEAAGASEVDLADRAAAEFIEQDADEGKTPKTRLDWPAEFKDEVLARLLALNAERAAAEGAAGLTAIPEDEDDDIDEAAVAE